MPLSPYHQHYAERSDEELNHRALVKKQELKKTFGELEYTPVHSPVRIAVLGCADKRFVVLHKEIFEELLQRPVELTTFDITTEHLEGEKGVMRHDCSLPLPNPPYDIMFGHVLLKFVETEKQWNVIRNSFDALCAPGLAIHVFDEEDITTTSVKQRDGYFSVPLERWKQKLNEEKIDFVILRWSMNPGTVQFLMRSIKGGALVLVKK